MSAISELKAIFENIKPNGTFNFTSEARQDEFTRNIEQANFPIMLIDDEVNTSGTILQGGQASESPNLRIYFLTKYDTSDSAVEYDTFSTQSSARAWQEQECVQPMKELGRNVIARYLTGDNIWRQGDNQPIYQIDDQYDIWSSGLFGALFTISHPRKESINYCTV